MKDGILFGMIHYAEDKDDPIEHEVTLLIGGFLVSGFIVSQENYFRSNSKIDKISSGILRLREAHPDEEIFDLEKLIPEFIHLRDAKFFVPGVTPMLKGVYWRGRLDSVDGFNLGPPAFVGADLKKSKSFAGSLGVRPQRPKR